MLAIKKFLEKNNSQKKFFLWFWIFFVLVLFFFWFQKFFLDQKKLEKNVEISSNWYNLTEKKYLDEKNFSFSDWDLIQRNIFLKNSWIFEVKNFQVEDYNFFSDKFISFSEKIKWWEVKILQYKTVAKVDEKNISEENFSEKILTRNEKIEKIFEVEIKNEKKNNSVQNLFEITWISKNTLNNNFNEYLEIFWKNLDSISNILISCQWKAEIFEIAKRDEWKISILVSQNSLEWWACQVWTEISWIWIFSNFFVNIKKENWENWIFLKHITPQKISSENWWMLVLQWKWFEKLVAVQIDNWVVLDLDFLEVLSDNALAVNIPKKMKVWEYFFRFMTKEGVYENEDLKIFVE